MPSNGGYQDECAGSRAAARLRFFGHSATANEILKREDALQDFVREMAAFRSVANYAVQKTASGTSSIFCGCDLRSCKGLD
jgi:hypothetical protein